MAQYALLTYHPNDPNWTAPESAAMMVEYKVFNEKVGPSFVGGAALFPTTTATSVRLTGGPDGELVTADGPFAETKEVLAGIFMIEAADLDAAIAAARTCPAAWHGTCEIRPIIEMD